MERSKIFPLQPYFYMQTLLVNPWIYDFAAYDLFSKPIGFCKWPPAVVAFLLASPWANMALTFLLIAFFGLKALFMIIGAIIIAIFTGFIFQFLETNNLIEHNKNSLALEEGFSIKSYIKRKTLLSDIKGIYRGMVSLGNMVLWWGF